MVQLQGLLENFRIGFNNDEITTTAIVTMLSMVTLFSFYEFLVYRYVSKRSFYSKHFNISLAVIPLFISSIIMALQSSLVISLGTIGALAIVRFRTAIKDPLDMVYLFWSVHTGIVVGTGLYEVAFLTSIVASFFILLLDFMPLGKAPYLLVINIDKPEEESQVINVVEEYSRNSNIKSRNFSANGIDMIIELRTKKEEELMSNLVKNESVKNVSLVAHDGEKEF